MNSEQKKYLVSVVVPVYNAGPFLRRCVESLVYQTLEDIELIFVNKESTDNSLDILNEYRRQFPEKVFVYNIPYSDTAAAGRNFGIKVSHADYIGFSDADDMMSYDAIEKLYNCAISKDYDIVITQFYDVKDGKKEIGNKLNIPLTIDTLIKSSNIAFWNKLIKKSILLEYGDIPENIIFDDLPYIIPLLSKVNPHKIGYLPRPVYYHINRSDSEAGSSCSPKLIQAISASEEVLCRVSFEYIDSAIYRLVKWFLHNIQNRWRFAQEFTEYLQKNRALFGNCQALKNDKPAYKRFLNLMNENYGLIPRIIYIPGFGRTVNEIRIEYLVNNAFNSPCDVVILNEQSCNIEENALILQAYKSGNYKFVNDYFAVRKIYEYGGVFVDDNIYFNNTLNNIRKYSSFFNFVNDSTYSDKIFGACAGHIVYESILKTYTAEFYNDAFYPLSKRIRNILTAKFSIPLIARTNISSYKTVIFAPSVMIADMTDIGQLFSYNICYWNYLGELSQNEVYSLQKGFNCFIGAAFRQQVNTLLGSNKDNIIIPKQPDKDFSFAKNLDELKKIKSSEAYLLATKLREYSKKPFGKCLKKIYFIFLRKHRNSKNVIRRK